MKLDPEAWDVRYIPASADPLYPYPVVTLHWPTRKHWNAEAHIHVGGIGGTSFTARASVPRSWLRWLGYNTDDDAREEAIKRAHHKLRCVIAARSDLPAKTATEDSTFWSYGKP